MAHKLEQSNRASESMAGLEKTLQNEEWRTFISDKKYQLQSKETKDIHLNSGFRPISLCIPSSQESRQYHMVVISKACGNVTIRDGV